jgi:hypothetical protein
VRRPVGLLALAAVIASVNMTLPDDVAHRLNLGLGAVLAVWAVVLIVVRVRGRGTR